MVDTPHNVGSHAAPSAVSPSVAIRRSPNGFFVDFDLLPDLLRHTSARKSREYVVATWARLMGGMHCDGRFQEHDGPDADLRGLAADAWRLAELCDLVGASDCTDTGRRVAEGTDALVQALAEGTRRYLVGQEGVEIVPLLQVGSEQLAETNHPWARLCPGLIPIEIGALIYWAGVNVHKCRELLDNLVTWRDSAMHRYGWPNPRASTKENAERHYDTVVDFYLSHPWLAERTPMPFGEELAMSKLLDFCGLLKEKAVGRFMAYLVPLASPARQGSKR